MMSGIFPSAFGDKCPILTQLDAKNLDTLRKMFKSENFSHNGKKWKISIMAFWPMENKAVNTFQSWVGVEEK